MSNWKMIGTNALEVWNNINNISDYSERKRKADKKRLKDCKLSIALDRMKTEKPKKLFKTSTEEEVEE